ncbi:MAG: mechanosensitive ion channel family protein [Gammaproteobacteria bacterium]|nr:mechanosensitive ion channel family protein [Gammaproteobacteria bacterium]NIR32853.1 mechanosensitive ion channel family protein [Gammaproteobacteria bacterium]NIR99400.1 mechanosensitive ion channel family protein [Gammaproteobacteria bacterium]NIT65014.1 mechanosensitive ion channel family protein [Gammaproteobacteria bacterium]NIV21928.1 mechanosensitive ion channel [Gammaproteobacteria bacterium]
MSVWEQIWAWLSSAESGAGWILQVFAVVFIALLFNLVVRRVLNRLYARLRTTRNAWDDALVDALRAPVTMLIWLVGLAYAAELVGEQAEADIGDLIRVAREVGIIAVVAWFLVRLIQRVEVNIISYREAAGEKVDHTTVDAVAKLLRISVLITAGLVTMETLGVNISAVLAFGGIGGIAIGFAARDLLANFFGGLMIYLDRPFSVGDWVRSPDREIEGIVEEIGWRLTRIRQFDKRPIYVPNSTFTSISVVNPSRMSHRRIYETVGVRYDDAAVLPRIVEDVKNMLREHPDIDRGQTLIVNFNEFGASSLNFFIYTFTRTVVWADYHAVKQDVLFKVLEIIERHGAEVAFPTSTVHVPDGLRLEANPALWAEPRQAPSSGAKRGS